MSESQEIEIARKSRKYRRYPTDMLVYINGLKGTITTIGRGGACIESESAPTTLVEIYIPSSDVHLKGQVRWSQQGTFGVEFVV